MQIKSKLGSLLKKKAPIEQMANVYNAQNDTKSVDAINDEIAEINRMVAQMESRKLDLMHNLSFYQADKSLFKRQLFQVAGKISNLANTRSGMESMLGAWIKERNEKQTEELKFQIQEIDKELERLKVLESKMEKQLQSPDEYILFPSPQEFQSTPKPSINPKEEASDPHQRELLRKAIYEYQSQSENELSWNVGDIIHYFPDLSNPDWAYGELNGVFGYFVLSYTEEYEEPKPEPKEEETTKTTPSQPEPSPAPSSPSITTTTTTTTTTTESPTKGVGYTWCTVLYDYTTDDNAFSVYANEELYFYEPQSDENWVCCVRDEELFYIPRNYIAINEEQPKVPKQESRLEPVSQPPEPTKPSTSFYSSTSVIAPKAVVLEAEPTSFLKQQEKKVTPSSSSATLPTVPSKGTSTTLPQKETSPPVAAVTTSTSSTNLTSTVDPTAFKMQQVLIEKLEAEIEQYKKKTTEQSTKNQELKKQLKSAQEEANSLKEKAWKYDMMSSQLNESTQKIRQLEIDLAKSRESETLAKQELERQKQKEENYMQEIRATLNEVKRKSVVGLPPPVPPVRVAKSVVHPPLPATPPPQLTQNNTSSNGSVVPPPQLTSPTPNSSVNGNINPTSYSSSVASPIGSQVLTQNPQNPVTPTKAVGKIPSSSVVNAKQTNIITSSSQSQSSNVVSPPPKPTSNPPVRGSVRGMSSWYKNFVEEDEESKTKQPVAPKASGIE